MASQFWLEISSSRLSLLTLYNLLESHDALQSFSWQSTRQKNLANTDSVCLLQQGGNALDSFTLIPEVFIVVMSLLRAAATCCCTQGLRIMKEISPHFINVLLRHLVYQNLWCSILFHKTLWMELLRFVELHPSIGVKTKVFGEVMGLLIKNQPLSIRLISWKNTSPLILTTHSRAPLMRVLPIALQNKAGPWKPVLGEGWIGL